MTKLICKLFLKNCENTNDPKTRNLYGKVSGVVGICTNALLCLLKIVTGILSNSVSILADGINNLTDASSSIITLIGFRLSSRPEDEEHPYGHARIEYITGMIISVLIIVLGIELLRSSITKIFNPEEFLLTKTVIAILIISIIIKIWQYSFYTTIGKKIDSVTLLAVGVDSRNDVIATSVVLFGLIFSYYTKINIDGYLGCMVAIFIVGSGISLVKETVNPLLGEAPDPSLVDSIHKIALNSPGVLGVHDLILHNYGKGTVFASLHIEVNGNENSVKCHSIIDEVEYHVFKELNVYLIGHMDPVIPEDPKRNRIVHIIETTIENLENVSNPHDIRLIDTSDGSETTIVTFDVIRSPQCTLPTTEITRLVQSKIDESYGYCTVYINFDKPYSK